MTLINAVLAEATQGQPEPTVGMGATILSWSDRSAATIIAVIRIGKKPAVQVTQDHSRVVKGSAHDGSAEYEYTTDPDGALMTFALTRDGWVRHVFNPETKRWNKSVGGQCLRIGERDTYYDPHF